MSYFYGAAATNFDSQVEKRTRRKHSKQRIPTNSGDLEPVHGSRHRRKHASRPRYVTRPKTTFSDMQNINCEEEKMLSPKSKSRRHLHKEIQRLLEENRALASRLEHAALDSVTQKTVTDQLEEKEASILKLRNKYQRLEKICQELQAEREKLKALLDQRNAEYRQMHMHHEELTQVLQRVDRERSSLSTIHQRFKVENAQLNEDVTLLKNLVYRLNVEIERYQDKLRQSGLVVQNQSAASVIDDLDTTSENKRMLESWGRVDLHALGPLLDAYQENLSEKDELIKKYGIEIDDFSGRCKEVISENEELHKEIEELKSKAVKHVEEMEMLARDAALVKEQNELLTKHNALQKQKLHEIHSAYEQKVESMSQDNNKLHKDYLACKTELGNLQGKYEILSEGYERLKYSNEKTMPISVHMAAVDECKRLFEELKNQYETEKRKLNSRIKYLEETQPENERQLIIVTAERDQLKTLMKNLEKNSKRTRHKLEHLQNSVYSIQVSRDSLKRQLNKTTSYCEDLVTEQEKLLMERDTLATILKERERENENIHHIGDNITHRMGNLKSQLKSVQKGAKEQLESVEKHIKNQELGVNQMKVDFHRELQRLKQLLKQKEDVIGKLRRDKCATQDNLELVWRAATSDDKKVKDALKNTKIYNI